MTSNVQELAPPAASADETEVPGAVSTTEPSDSADSTDTVQSALEAEVARRIDAVERRWQSRKDRELNRARRRWESEAGQAIDPELLAWIAEADARDVGQWLKAGLADRGSAPLKSDAPRVLQPATSAKLDDSTAPPPAQDEAQSASQDSDGESNSAPAERPVDGQADAGRAEDTPPASDVEREAEARERLAERRSLDPSPDLFPSRGAPADAFQQIESGFARGEVDLETYETARRRRGLV